MYSAIVILSLVKMGDVPFAGELSIKVRNTIVGLMLMAVVPVL